jgi:DNA-binding beta-propeller fold protein YncE
MRARIEGPLLAEATAPLISRFPKAVAELPVGPITGWVDSGITVRRADRLLVSAEGAWADRGVQAAIDANGTNRTMQHLRMGALIGRVGQHGQRVHVGALHLFEASEPGKLYLAVNVAAPVAVRPPANWLGGLAGALKGPVARIPQGALKVTIRAGADFENAKEALGLPVRLAASQGGVGGMAAAVSPDGKLLAVDTRANTILLARSDTGAGIRQLGGHADRVSTLAFTSDSKRLVSASRDRTVRLWDVATGKTIRTFTGHRGPSLTVTVSPDMMRLASCGDDGTVLVWDVATGEPLPPLPLDDPQVALAFSPDGSRLATVSRLGWLRLWDVKTWQPGKPVFARLAGVVTIAWSQDGSRLALGGRVPCVRTFDVNKGEWGRTGHTVTTWARAIAWTADREHLAAACWDGTVRIWDAATLEQVRTIDAHPFSAMAVAFLPDGKRLVSTGRDGTLRIWALAAQPPPDMDVPGPKPGHAPEP